MPFPTVPLVPEDGEYAYVCDAVYPWEAAADGDIKRFPACTATKLPQFEDATDAVEMQ